MTEYPLLCKLPLLRLEFGDYEMYICMCTNYCGSKMQLRVMQLCELDYPDVLQFCKSNFWVYTNLRTYFIFVSNHLLLAWWQRQENNIHSNEKSQQTMQSYKFDINFF